MDGNTYICRDFLVFKNSNNFILHYEVTEICNLYSCEENWISEVQRTCGPQHTLEVLVRGNFSIYCPQNNYAVVTFPAYRVDGCNASL